MKKSTLFMACCIGLMLFASCKKDPIAPTITTLPSPSYEIGSSYMYSGDEITVGFQATGEKLTKIEVVISQNGTVLASHSESIDNQETYDYWHSFTFEAEGNVNIRGTVTDAAGQTASKDFDILYKEKPNAKFVGRYEGNALATGIMRANISGMDPIEEEFSDREMPVVLELREGANTEEVMGTCTLEDRTIDCYGTVEGNTVTFEAINDVITFNYSMGGFNISPQMNMTYNIKGTLTDGQLLLDGTCSGNGNINLFIYNGTVEMDATVGGSLTKN